MKHSTDGTSASEPAERCDSEVSQPLPVHGDWLLDEALQETLPASDPIAPAGDAPGGSHGRNDPVARPQQIAKEPSMTRPDSSEGAALHQRRQLPLATPTDLNPAATKEISAAMNAVLADVYALYLKTKNFHWQMSGPHFRDYHLMLDEQSVQLFAMTDPIAERIRKLGGTTLRSIGHISRTQRVSDNDAEYVEPLDMLAELREDNKTLAGSLREAHNLCVEHRDIATASLIEVWIDETERRTWFLFESGRRGDSGGH
jgi:starvation-inducible DNA-binding protein